MRRVLPGLAAVALLTAACGNTQRDETVTAATAPAVTAAAAVYPLAWLAQEIAPDAEVEFLGAGSAEAHDLELTPGQRGAVESADVLLHMGEIGYQPQIEQAAGSAEGEVVDVSEVAGEDRLLQAADDAHEGEEHAEGEEQAEGEEHGEGEGSVDPHVWFDPTVMADVAERTGAAFAAADPDNADTYTANAERISTELSGMSGEIDAVLSDCRFDEVIVSHAAYGYLLQPRGYGQHAVVGVTSGEAGASGAELAEIVAEVEGEGFTHVLAEPVEGRADAEAVARETGVEMLDVHPLDVVTDEQAGQGYPQLLQEQVDAFATALGCT